ncbi:hypothetical protein [Tahibacter caeni]|uniref:hypothetical protein n=1 Tax=Tahibacter caeni TaxID=1453545 RepID=UPI0021484B59|nr:hypothetical protein [Tahibacter caeni]
MPLTSFENNIYRINHTIDYPEIVCVEYEDTMEVVLAVDPVTSEKVIDELKLTSNNSDYVSVWKNATGVTFDPLHDQITGNIMTPDPPDPVTNEIAYHNRAFCLSLTGNPTQRTSTIHCFISKTIGGGGGDPDDGSWAGDVD